jgi:hypothetical protein
VHELDPARVQQRPEVLELVGAAAAQLRRSRAQQGERREQSRLGQHRRARDQTTEAVPQQVQRLARLLPQHP